MGKIIVKAYQFQPLSFLRMTKYSQHPYSCDQISLIPWPCTITQDKRESQRWVRIGCRTFFFNSLLDQKSSLFSSPLFFHFLASILTLAILGIIVCLCKCACIYTFYIKTKIETVQFIHVDRYMLKKDIGYTPTKEHPLFKSVQTIKKINTYYITCVWKNYICLLNAVCGEGKFINFWEWHFTDFVIF